MTQKILILFAHPAFQRSRANRAMLQAVDALPFVTVNDLYERYPDFAVDVAAEQQMLREHQGLVLQHPLYWYSCPALLKEWIDLVLEHGFAYGDGANALQGKWLLSAVSSGASLAAYAPGGLHGHSLDAFLLPFAQTAALCGMRYLKPFVVDGLRQRPAAAALQAHAASYRELLSRLAAAAPAATAAASAAAERHAR